MKLSKMIEQLNEILKKDGDLDVYRWSEDHDCHVNVYSIMPEMKVLGLHAKLNNEKTYMIVSID